MSNSIESFWNLLATSIHKCGTLMSLVDAPKARQLPLRPPRAGEQLVWHDQDEVLKFFRESAAVGGILALVTDGKNADGLAMAPLAEPEVRFFRATVDLKSGELQLTQASRLHASLVLTRLQMRGMFARDLTPAGPYRGYQQLYLPEPFY